MQIQEDKQIVTRALVILFLSLTIVYSLLYMRKSDIFTASFEGQSSTGSIQQTGNELPIPVLSSGAVATTNENHGSGTNLRGETLSNIQNSASGVDLSSLNNSLASTTPVVLLSGTTQFFGVLDIIDILGKNPEYILQDNKENLFAYYGTKGLDFVRTVQQLGGNVYTMATESEILQNQLFGDKVSFINLQAFKDKQVLIVIELEGKTWLLQIPADKYHTSKSYLKSLFIY